MIENPLGHSFGIQKDVKHRSELRVPQPIPESMVDARDRVLKLPAHGEEPRIVSTVKQAKARFRCQTMALLVNTLWNKIVNDYVPNRG